jgi:hypothetical protein
METVKCSAEWKEMMSKTSTSLIVGGKVIAHSCLDKFEDIFQMMCVFNYFGTIFATHTHTHTHTQYSASYAN